MDDPDSHITYWDNPWDDAISVPLRELAETIAEPDQFCRMEDGAREPMDAEHYLREWAQYGNLLDAYVLLGPDYVSVGVRFGQKGHEYLSPYARDQDAARALGMKYKEE
jgi:hypothetical protein